ncbi:MAG: hypothetical protein WBI17_03540, partial [Clostridiaceae bacterium]
YTRVAQGALVYTVLKQFKQEQKISQRLLLNHSRNLSYQKKTLIYLQKRHIIQPDKPLHYADACIEALLLRLFAK